LHARKHANVLRANMPLPLDFPIVQWGEYFTMTFITFFTRWRLCRNSPHVISLHEGTHVRRFSKMFLKPRLFTTSVMKHIFIWLDASTNKTCATRLTPIPENCIKDIHLKSQCGVQFPPLFEGSNTKTTNRIKGLGLMIWRFVFMKVTIST